ncbi:signal transduction histidine kinase [Arthrobacter stackebrandtii]|uniref:histidine kinase n=1 Tax=Arthrobacter stackebrandtii TaxID=272161 RepID=A0ABS4YX40_9MICC|nr:HAMP domain-containing sensor histidine kinase [Arthrobacter stackebrandtii]MBP2413380.1 signal transduction histidine kinase [Arthrobacter stackebrandtii]PYG99530.1 sensor histidine kinase [Arthrobacter stackebrandtii]
MSARRPAAPHAPSADSPQLRRAAVTVGLRIAVAAALMVVVVIIAAALYMLYLSHHPDTAAADAADRVYVESNDMLKAMALAGFAGIVAAGAIGWLSARSAIRPVGRALDMQRRFVQDASHELRTPLAILDARVQLAELKVEPGSDAARILAQVRQDTAALTDTVQELLLAAMGDAGTTSEPLAVAPVIADVAAGLQDLAASRGISLAPGDAARSASSGDDDGPRVRIAANSLRRAVMGLVDNALNHTPAGGSITVVVAQSGSWVSVTVSDTGSGIAGIEPSRVFDRFARSSEAPAGGRRSYGLGLALVREIATAAGGTVEVTETGPSGTTMTLTLPAA